MGSIAMRKGWNGQDFGHGAFCRHARLWKFTVPAVTGPVRASRDSIVLTDCLCRQSQYDSVGIARRSRNTVDAVTHMEHRN